MSKRQARLIISLIFFALFTAFGWLQFSEKVSLISPTASPKLAPALVSVPTPTPSPEIHRDTAGVARVVDGDTIELDTGKKVRYIGVDTPETKHPKKPVQWYGEAAYQKNKSLVEGKTVTLEKDVSEVDRYGRLLRYVYLDGVMVNETLVKEGYARVSTFPPDVKYHERFLVAEREARTANRGLWSAPVAGEQKK